MKIKNLSDFKRAMQVGSTWRFYDSRFTENYIIRECTHSQSKNFALNNHPNRKDPEESSWLDYPPAKNILFIQEEGQPTKVKIHLFNDVYLIYQPYEGNTNEK